MCSLYSNFFVVALWEIRARAGSDALLSVHSASNTVPVSGPVAVPFQLSLEARACT